MITENIEGLADWNIVMGERIPGISAMVRLKEEAEYVIRSLESILFCDEIVICLQGEQTDGTDVLVKEWAKGRDNIFVYEYPFDSLPNGPGHDKQPKGSVYERAYFYNWCLSKTTRSHVLKWDGDMVAVKGIENYLKGDLASIKGKHVYKSGKSREVVFGSCYFRVTPETYYITGPKCEDLTIRKAPVVGGLSFIHYKWLKSEASITKAWPKNWREIEHFRNLRARSK